MKKLTLVFSGLEIKFKSIYNDIYVATSSKIAYLLMKIVFIH